jgi:hypothetical protein
VATPQGRESGVVMDLRLLKEVSDELERAQDKFAKFNSPHEGYAVILEELDELWDEVRSSGPALLNRPEMRKEAIQVAAMALRFIVDICEDKSC